MVVRVGLVIVIAFSAIANVTRPGIVVRSGEEQTFETFATDLRERTTL